ADRADEGPGERDEATAQRRQSCALDGHVRAEERDEHRSRDVQTLPARLDDVPELVHEDEHREADTERPAVEPERVRRGGGEEAAELGEDEAPLQRGPADDEGPADAAFARPVR